MIRKIVNLGGPAKYVRVAPVGHGLMCMTVRPETIPDEQCFEAIKAGIDERRVCGAIPARSILTELLH